MTIPKIQSIKIGAVSIGSLKPQKIGKKADADEITAECAKELSGQAEQIKRQESKLAERMDFDNDRCYYFSVVFRSTEERDAWLKAKKIKLHSESYVFADELEAGL